MLYQKHALMGNPTTFSNELKQVQANTVELLPSFVSLCFATCNQNVFSIEEIMSDNCDGYVIFTS